VRHLTYLALLLACVCLTVPLEFALRTRVLTRLPILLLAITPGFAVFLAWDVYAIRHGQWSYDFRWMSGVVLPGRVPLEEALFFVVIPVAAVLTYEGVHRYLPRLTGKAPLRAGSDERMPR
jgi:lycopene cyclase domain-containing protein